MKKIVLISAISISLLFCSCSTANKNQSNEENQTNSTIQITGFNQDGNTFSTKVDNNVITYSFLDKVTVEKGADWKMYGDVAGSIEIPTKTVSLEIGDNNYYILVTPTSGESSFYTVLVRRLDLFTVNFLSVNGAIFETQNIQEESKAIAPTTNPTASGYDFKGWDYDFDNVVLEDLDINSIWEAHSITISFDVNGGDPLQNDTMNIKYGQYVTLPTPTRVGHSFDGWYYNNSKINSGSWRIDGNVSLQAHWSKKIYYVNVVQTLNCNVNVNNSAMYEEGLNILLTPHSSTGYNFLNPIISLYRNSSLDEDDLITRVNSNSYIFTMSGFYYSNIYIKAEYAKEPQKVLISLDGNGGYFDSDTSKTTCSFEHSYGTSETLTDQYTTIEKTGYTFKGWFDSNDNQIVSIESDRLETLTLHAEWEIGHYLVEFDKDLSVYLTLDYGYNNLVDVIEYKSGEDYKNEIDIKRSGYVLAGWYFSEDESDTNNFDFKTAIVGDTTLYARWVAKSSSETLISDIVKNGKTVSVPSKTYWHQETYRADESGLFTLSFTTYATVNQIYAMCDGERVDFNNENDNSKNIHKMDFYAVAGDLVVFNVLLKDPSSYTSTNLALKMSKQDYPISTKIIMTCESIQVIYNESYFLPIPNKDGYNFVGWFDENNYQYPNSGIWNTPHSVVLYSRFVAK